MGSSVCGDGVGLSVRICRAHMLGTTKCVCVRARACACVLMFIISL